MLVKRQLIKRLCIGNFDDIFKPYNFTILIFKVYKLLLYFNYVFFYTTRSQKYFFKFIVQMFSTVTNLVGYNIVSIKKSCKIITVEPYTQLCTHICVLLHNLKGRIMLVKVHNIFFCK